MRVTETFFSLEVADMARAIAFYVDALGATIGFDSPRWTSLHIAGVRIGLALQPSYSGGRVGLHFAVDDLDAACAAVERAGGRINTATVEVAPGVIMADVADTEGNAFALNKT